jgi:hypothetical protein
MTRLASRLGPLELENGYPIDATVAKIFDDIDYQRACQAYLWALPLMAMQQWQSEHLEKFGAGGAALERRATARPRLLGGPCEDHPGGTGPRA